MVEFAPLALSTITQNKYLKLIAGSSLSLLASEFLAPDHEVQVWSGVSVLLFVFENLCRLSRYLQLVDTVFIVS